MYDFHKNYHHNRELDIFGIIYTIILTVKCKSSYPEITYLINYLIDAQPVFKLDFCTVRQKMFQPENYEVLQLKKKNCEVLREDRGRSTTKYFAFILETS